MHAELILLGWLTVTSYRPTPAQTRPECRDVYNCDTAEGDRCTKHGVAVSRDLLETGQVSFGDVLYIPGFGYKVVNDKMGPKAKGAIDIMVFTKDQEKRMGVKMMYIYKVEVHPYEERRPR